MGVFTEISSSPNVGQMNWIKVNFGLKAVESALTVFDFEDHGHQVCYVPTLNLSAYGKTLDEARDMLLNVVLDDFFANMVELSEPAVFEYLSKLGWSCRGREERNFENSAYIDKDGVLKNFDLPRDTPIQEQMLTVA